jgi:hypothetical protein
MRRELAAAAVVAVAAAGVYLVFVRGKKKSQLKYVMGEVNYQAEHVPASVRSSGKVFVDRSTAGSDSPPVGEKQIAVRVPIRDARGLALTLDANGVKLVDHPHLRIDYEDLEAVARDYYPECCRLVKEHTGAKEVIAFDHNLRGSAVQSWMNKASDANVQSLGPQYQSPAAIVHGDYTVTSAPLRLRMLSQPPKANDTWKCVTNGRPLIDPLTVAQRLQRRYVFLNVWRNIADDAVMDMPLGVVDAMTVPNEDLVTFEVRYVDRTGENYLAKYAPAGGVADAYHKWLYFPRMTKNEALLLKTWDSAGPQFRGFEGGGHTGTAGTGTADEIRSTFCLHSAFKDETAPADCPKRRSIEVRLVAFF